MEPMCDDSTTDPGGWLIHCELPASHVKEQPHMGFAIGGPEAGKSFTWKDADPDA